MRGESSEDLNMGGPSIRLPLRRTIDAVGLVCRPQRWVGTVTGVPGNQMAFLEEGS